MSAKWLLLALLFRPGFGVTGNTPALVYSTYAGVGPNEIALSVAVDQDGNAYLLTSSAGSMLGSKVVVKKVSPDGSHLLFSTVLPLFILNDGGVFFPAAAAIAIDASGDIYVAGTLTDATLLKPTRGAAQSSPGGGTDGFVLKLSRDGSRVIYASYIGGSGSDTVTALCVDSGGNAYITGYTNSSDFPVTAGAYQTGIKGEDDAFVIKVNPTGTSFVYATYLGGAGIDQANAIAVDHVGNVHLTGATESADFPTTPAVAFPSQKRGGRDVFVSKLDSAGAVLLYSVCLGGSGDDEGRGIAVDPAGNIFVAGRTFSDDFPLQSALQDQGAAFAAKLIPGGSGGVVYSTRLGGLGWATGIAVNNLGEAFITGITDSDLPTTPRAYQPVRYDQTDAFLMKLDAAGSALLYATYLGGNGKDIAGVLALDPSGNAYIAGSCYGGGFPITQGAYSAYYPSGAGSVPFVAKIDTTGSPGPPELNPSVLNAARSMTA